MCGTDLCELNELMMRKYGFFVLMALAFAMVQACSMNNDILKPSCEVFEVELVNKWWQPQGQKQAEAVMFTADGTMKWTNTSAEKNYELANCNTLRVTDEETGTMNEWTIQDLNLDRLVIVENGTTVHYSPK